MWPVLTEMMTVCCLEDAFSFCAYSEQVLCSFDYCLAVELEKKCFEKGRLAQQP